MSAPVINPPTSVLAPYIGESWGYQPSATGAPTSWKEIIPAYSFTVNASTDVCTASGSGFTDGDRVRVSSSTTLPAPLVQNAYYYVRDASGTTFKLSLTLGGGAINLTDTGTGTHTVATTALPPGLGFNKSTGLISGIPKTKGFYEVTLAATNGDGESAPFVFPIGVRDARALLDSAIALQWDWDTNLISLLGGRPSTDPKNPLLYFKNGDQLVFGLQFMKSGFPFRPSITSLTAGLKDEDNNPLFAKASGAYGIVGDGPDARFFFLVDITAVPTGGQSALNILSDAETQGPDIAPAWFELRAAYQYDVLNSGTPSIYNRASRSVPVELDRAILA